MTVSSDVHVTSSLSAIRVSVAAAGVPGMDKKAGGLVICRRSMSPWKHTLVGASYED